MSNLTVKNRRLKVSPKGMITLSVAARKALGMEQGKPTLIGSKTDGKTILFSAKPGGENNLKVSKGGMVRLSDDLVRVITSDNNRHYWVELDDRAREVRLLPF